MISTAQQLIDADLTMVPLSGVLFAMDKAVEATRAATAVQINLFPQDVIVECGVWRGGCSIAMMLAQREAFGKVRVPVWMLDSFTGLPPAQQVDGPAANRWQRATDHNCRADLAELQVQLAKFELGEDRAYRLFPGLFADTLPQIVRADPRIVLLRLDCDWYDSVSHCLQLLEPLVMDGGTVILDDYYAWDGAARAVHDYLAFHGLSYRIKSLPDFSAAYFVKEVR